MSGMDIHPEHLFDRVRHGLASHLERRELALHLQSCKLCALEWRLADVLRAPDDEPVAAKGDAVAAIDAALETLTAEGRLLPERGRFAGLQLRGRFVPWAAALCLFFTGSAAAATLIMAVRQNAAPAAQLGAGEHAGAKRALTARVTVTAAPEAVAELPAQRPSASATANVAPAEPARMAAASANRDASDKRAREARSGAAQAHGESADELFERARAAMMKGEQQRAVSSFLELQQRFAGSSQAQVSRVLLGRLFLEELNQPSAALLQFEGYLERPGENRPEALLGRARALRALGRTQEEVEALRALVDGYPGSLYVAPAQKRLRAIR
jgi:TolA-binding protein